MKKLTKNLLLMLAVFVSGTLFAASPISGGQYLNFGLGVQEASLGYSGMATLGSMSGSDYNPAALGNLRRVANNFSINGLGTGDLLLNTGVAVPTVFGVFSGNLLYLSSTAGADPLNLLVGGKFNLAKPITSDLFFGTSLKFAYGALQSTSNDWQLGLDVGILKTDFSKGQRFGLNHLTYGFALHNLGKIMNFGGTYENGFPPLALGAGVSFDPIQLNVYRLKVISDVNFDIYPLDFSASLGLENTLFDLIKIRAGYNFNNVNLGPFGFGLGFTGQLDIKGSKTDIDISYAAQMQKTDFNSNATTYEWMHGIELSVAWGYYDNVAPQVSVTPSFQAFSPNFDGRADTLDLKLNIKDNQLVDAWQVDILDAKGNVVRSFKSVEKLKVRNLSPEKVFRQITSSKEQVEIPQKVEWDGLDTSGNRVPDGNYSYVLKATDANGNVGTTKAGTVIVDTVVPVVVAKPNLTLFSPNGDGSKDTLVFEVSTSNLQKGDKVSAVVKNEKGNVVRSYHYEDQAPQQVEWNGKDDNGNPVAEGTYSVDFQVQDAAGNVTEQKIADIRMITNYQKVKLKTSATAFSPNHDGVNDNISFDTSVSDQTGLETWKLIISDASGKPIKTFKGNKELPATIVWDGLDDNGKLVADGDYTYDLSLEFDSGNHPKTDKQTIHVDHTAMEVKVKPEYLSFSPNGDGKQDSLKFKHQLKGEPKDVIQISIENSSGNPVFYNKLTKAEFDKQYPDGVVEWKGLDKNLKPLSEGKYTYVLETEDAVGNRSRFEQDNIVLKTGLEKVSVTPSLTALSPNGDGANDTLTFECSATSTEGLTSFDLSILNVSKQTVKSFKSQTFQNKIKWDGKDNTGKILPDGNYTCRLKLKYNFGDEPISKPRMLVVDTVAPKVKLFANTLAFSPNGDGRKETVTFTNQIKGENSDRYAVLLTDSKNRVVRKYSFKGNVPKTLSWGGYDAEGNAVSEGSYFYRVVAQDNAKNRTDVKVGPIRLVHSFEKQSFVSDGKPWISPNGDGNRENLVLKSKINSTNGLIASRLKVETKNGKVLYKKESKGALPKEWNWDGKDNNGKVIADGNYRLSLESEFDSGNLIISTISPLIVDTTPPVFKLNVAPLLFTPDGDGENDTLFINLSVEDPNKVAKWDLSIRKKDSTSIFKHWSGTGTVKKLIKWDGLNDSKEDLVEAVQDYELTLTAKDSLGNTLPDIHHTIPVGVLVERTKDGLRIRVSSITFDVNKANLNKKSKAVLDKVIKIVTRILSDKEKYAITDGYQIEVSGHTDDQGKEDYNQTLSEKRAKAVYQYLVQKDLDPAILSYKGYGEQRLYKGLTAKKIRALPKAQRDLYRQRSRRVEFFIRK